MKKLKQILLFILTALFLVSCSSSKETVKEQELIIYPSPPEKTRIQYLTSFSTAFDITGEQSEFLSNIVGEKENRAIVKPYGIAIYKGKIYICDTILGGIIIIDLSNSTFEYFTPKGLGDLKNQLIAL